MAHLHLLHRSVVLLSFAAAVQVHAQWNYDWAVQSNSPNVENATSCAVSADGHVAVTGDFQIDLQWGAFSGDGLPGNGLRGFVAYLDPSGTFQWAHVFSSWHESGSNCQAYDVAMDPDGNVFVGGQFNDSLLLDGVNVLTPPDTIPAGARTFYVAKFSPAGVLSWVKAVGIEGYTGQLQAIAADGNGDVYVVGEGGFDHGRFAKLDGGTGAMLFFLSPDGAGAFIHDVATDAENNVYILGQATSAFTMGGMDCPYNNVLGPGSTPLFVGKFSSAGQALWYYVRTKRAAAISRSRNATWRRPRTVGWSWKAARRSASMATRSPTATPPMACSSWMRTANRCGPAK